MAARSVWKGFLRLNLVSLPVKAYSAMSAKANEIHLNQLHADCNSRIKYKKSCPIHGDVANDEVVSGYEYAKDQYVIVDGDDVDKLRSAEEKAAMTVDAFVDPDDVDAVCFTGKNFYLLPDGPMALRAYHLVRVGLVESGKVAVARVVLFGRDQYVVLRPRGDLLAFSVMAYAEQLAGAFDAEVANVTVAAEELDLIKTLISASCKPFDPSSFKDRYAERLLQFIQAKIDGQEIAPRADEPAQVINLMDALRRSVATSSKPQTKPKLGKKPKAARVGQPTKT